LTHKFQTEWFDADVEAAYLQRIETWVHAGDLDIASETLMADIETLGTPLAQMCMDLSEDAVEISGWEEIVDAIAAFEGDDPITAVHIVMSNEDDLVFEDKNITQNPDAEVVFYTDEHLPFSALSRDELLAETLEQNPEWFGKCEDVEVYLELNGLGNLNTALLRHKRQYYFRDEQHVLDAAEGRAVDEVPLPYIEFRLCAMLRAVRFHQAVKNLLDGYGISGQIPVIVGMHNMRLEIGSVYQPKQVKVQKIASAPKLAITIKRNLEEEEPELIGSSLRRLAVTEPEEKVGFFRRLFRRKAA
jgi:hypothetical protein